VEGLIDSLISWGADVIVALQSVSTPTLDALFRGITYLGQEPFWVLVVLVVLWRVGREQGVHLGILLLVTYGLNLLIKRACMEPRPFLVHPEVEAKLLCSGYSFPSGHAQTSATAWPAMAHFVRRRWFTVASIVMVFLVSLSRVYLGVHYPHDVIAGILVGLAVFLGYLRTRRLARRWHASSSS